MRVDLDKLLELEAKATTNNWYLDATSIPSDLLRAKKGNIIWGQYDFSNPNDARLIAAMRNNIRQLCLELRAAREVIEQFENQIHFGYSDLDKSLTKYFKVTGR